MESTSPASKLIAAVSRRGFFGRAAVAGSAVLLGSSIPSRVGAEDKKEDKNNKKKEDKKEEESRCGSPGLCDFPVPIPHINTPRPPGGAHFYFPGPVDGSAVPTDPTTFPDGRDPSPIFNFKGFIGVADLDLTGTGTDLQTGASVPYGFHTDMRFMHGVFVGTDLIERQGSFVFV